VTNRPRIKGTAFETEVARYLRDNGFPHVERIGMIGSHSDRGDLTGIPGTCWELKATKSLDLAQAVTEAVTEAENCGEGVLPIALLKRRQKPTGRAYGVMELETLCRLLREAGYGEAL
jgi:hypothetical protein